MKQLFLDNPKKIIQEKENLEKELNVKILSKENTLKGTSEILIDGNAEDEYLAEKIIEATNLGFSIKRALLIKKQNLMFEILNIKNYMRGSNIARVKGRIVGESGRVLATLSQLTDCYLEIKGNQIGIIGDPDNIKNTQNALIMLIKGSKHANVYAFLEKHHPEPILDFGLKENKKFDGKKSK